MGSSSCTMTRRNEKEAEGMPGTFGAAGGPRSLEDDMDLCCRLVFNDRGRNTLTDVSQPRAQKDHRSFCPCHNGQEDCSLSRSSPCQSRAPWAPCGSLLASGALILPTIPPRPLPPSVSLPSPARHIQSYGFISCIYRDLSTPAHHPPTNLRLPATLDGLARRLGDDAFSGP